MGKETRSLLMNRFLCSVLICILVPFISVQRIFAEEEEDLPFTDTVIDQLVDISSSIDSRWLSVNLESKSVVDNVLVRTVQGQYQTLTPSGNDLYITGTYHDNTITGIQQCSSSSYNYSTNQHQIEGVCIVQTELDSGLQHSSQNMFLNLALDVSTTTGAQETITTNSLTNTTEACALMGMNSGDGAVDGTVLQELGYEQHTVSYNDGSTDGHTATVYVPGNESISLGIDGEYISDIIDNIVINFIQSAIYQYHEEYSLYLTANPGYYVPSYGQIKSYTYFPNLISPNPDTSNVSVRFDPSLSEPGVTANFNKRFSYHTSLNSDNSHFYDRNYFELTWQGTDQPYWKFVSDPETVEYSLYNPKYPNISITSNTTALSDEYYTITSSDVSEDADLTAGYLLSVYPGFYYYKLYKYQDSGRLGLFNQLGNFLNNWFNRIKTSIDSITGNQDVVQQIENDYNVDFDTSINNYIQNIQNTSQQIDLTAPENNLPQGNHLSEFAPVVSETLKVFTDNGVWIFIFVPILIAILGLIL